MSALSAIDDALNIHCFRSDVLLLASAAKRDDPEQNHGGHIRGNPDVFVTKPYGNQRVVQDRGRTKRPAVPTVEVELHSESSRWQESAFAKPTIYDALDVHGVEYAIRMPANENLEWEIAELLCRPPGRPSLKPLVRCKRFSYQAGTWTKARRVVAKVEHHGKELFPRVGFIVTNMTLRSRSVVRFYTKRGMFEHWIKKGKHAAHLTRLSCHRFRANEARLQLSVLAYNLGNLWRRSVLPKRIDTWSLARLRHLVKTGG